VRVIDERKAGTMCARCRQQRWPFKDWSEPYTCGRCREALADGSAVMDPRGSDAQRAAWAKRVPPTDPANGRGDRGATQNDSRRARRMATGKVITRCWTSPGPTGRRVRRTSYGYDVRINGKRERKFSGDWSTEAEALAALSKRLTDAAAGRVPAPGRRRSGRSPRSTSRTRRALGSDP
jgi:hypothetical protein